MDNPFEKFDSMIDQRRNKCLEEIPKARDSLLHKVLKEKGFGRQHKRRMDRLIQEYALRVNKADGFYEQRKLTEEGYEKSLQLERQASREAEEFLGGQLEEITMQALDREVRNYMRKTVDDLIGCAMILCDKKPEDMEKDYRIGTGARFLSELLALGDLGYLNRLIGKVPAVGELFYDLFLGQSEKQQELVKKAVKGLQKNSYLTKKEAELLISFMYPAKKESSFKMASSLTKSSPNSWTAEKIVPTTKQPERETEKESENLEELTRDYLTEFFSLNEETAKKFSGLSFDNLLYTFDSLERLLGEEKAKEIIKTNPEVLTYLQKNQFNKYLKNLEMIFNHTKGKEILAGQDSTAYSCLDGVLELKQQLYPKNIDNGVKEGVEEEKEKRIDLARYTFLNNKNESIRGRVLDLVEIGKVQVGGYEYWTGQSGARGRHILINMRYQMKCLFSELGFPEPKCQINFSEYTLQISKADQDYLSLALSYVQKK